MPTKKMNLLRLTALSLALIGAGLCQALAATAPVTSGEVIAKVNGQAITKDQLVQRLIAYHGVYDLETLIGEAMLKAKAAAAGITVTDQEVNQRIEEQKKDMRISDPEAFRSWLISSEFTESRFRDKVYTSLLVEKTFANEAAVSETEVAGFYDKNKEKFIVKPTVKITSLKTNTEEMAQKAYDLLSKGRSFQATAAELGKNSAEVIEFPVPVPTAGLPILVRAAMEKTNPGQLTSPIKLPQNPNDISSPATGYVVIKVIAKDPGGLRPFNEVKGEIRQAMFKDRIFGQAGLWERWLDQTKLTADVERLMVFQGEPKPESKKPAATSGNK